MHHSDKELDPIKNTKGFGQCLRLWTVKSASIKYVKKDLYANPRMVFFHNHWGKIWIGSAIVSAIISRMYLWHG